MLCLLAATERFVASRGWLFLDYDDWAYKRNDHWAERKARGYDVLCFGDSLVKYGFVPSAVAERSGRTVYNLAIPGSQAPASYFLLRRAIDSGARPEAVVVDFHLPLLRLGPRHNLGRWASLLRVSEAAELAVWARDPGLFGAVAVGRLIPSVCARPGLRDHIKATLKGRDVWRPWTNLAAFRNWNRNGGAQMMAPNPEFQKLTDAEFDRYCVDLFSDVGCHPANVEAARRFLALAAEHGVPVYWVLTPVASPCRAALARCGILAKHDALFATWQARFPNLVIVDGRAAVADLGAYFDQTHLAASGAYAFSLALGDVLRRTLTPRRPADARGLPSTRWVAVPACETRRERPELEDFSQSHLAVDPSAWTRRF
jgi:hypothetical protein